MVKCDNNETAVEMIIERNNMIMQKFERETPAKKKRCIAPIVAKQYGITPNDNNNAPSPPPSQYQVNIMQSIRFVLSNMLKHI